MGIAKILIVDDRPENLLTLESLLDREDVDVIRASSGSEALSSMLEHEFALVLLDVQMPEMDGYEVAELMRGNKRTRHIPIIFVTAVGKGQSQVFKGYESGAVDYLFKPLDAHIFQSKVNVFIELFNHQVALEVKTKELDQKLVELEEVQQQLEETNRQLLLLSMTDGLTGLCNKRQFEVQFMKEWGRAYRNQKPLSLLLVDIDHFKLYNDTYGHTTGDECLISVAHALSKAVRRDVDMAARVGGEEFAILLPDTDVEGAKFVAERVRQNVLALRIEHKASPVADIVTTCVGAATMTPGQKEGKLALMQIADNALYQAKGDGRNTLCCFPCQGKKDDDDGEVSQSG